MRFIFLFLLLLAVSAGAFAQTVVTKYSELVAREPGQQTPNLKVWTIRQNEKIRINLVEMVGEQRLHVHPDAAHSLMVLEGRLKVFSGGQPFWLAKGDFISIPAKTAHKYWSLSAKSVVVSMDAPYYDPTKTIVLE